MANVALVILAAGEGRRFGGVKQRALWRGKPLIRWSVDACLAVPDADAFVVLGAHREAIRPVLNADAPGVLVNRDWREGMAASIRTAVQQLGDYSALLFLAGDQPGVRADHLQRMVGHWRGEPQRIVAARYGDTPGIPVLFPADLFPELLALEGDRGARGLLTRHGERVLTLDMPEAALDIDRPTDLQTRRERVSR